MSGHLPRTNRWLVLLSVILCIVLGGIFTRSSSAPSQVSASSETGFFVSGDQDSSEFTSEETVADNNDNFTDTSSGDSNNVPDSSSVKNSSEDSSKTSRNKSSENAGKKSDVSSNSPALSSEVSAEASKGIWASSGSNWMFLIDNIPYTGWLTDTDGKQYYMDNAGIMQTGWTDIGNKRYYFDMDGILQTGTVNINGKSYELNEDGSLKNYTAKKKSSKKKSSKKSSKKSAAKSKSKSTSSSNSKSADSAKSIALTFDDGPSSFTDRLLDCLEQNDAKATFFMVGTEIDSFPDEVKRMKKLGCELGNHTYDHTDLTTLSAEDISSEIAQVDERLVNLTGEGASVVRPPYGSVNDTVKTVVGTPMILWSIDTLDWKTLDVESTVEEVMNNVQDGSIILMHDIYSTSVDAAEILIPQLIEDGYQLVTVHELASLHNQKLSAGITYGEFDSNQ